MYNLPSENKSKSIINRLISELFRNEGNLKEKTLRSSVWMLGSTGITKFLSFVKILILVRLLVPEDFGLMGIALFAVLAMDIFTQTGMVAALIQQKKDIQYALNTAWTIQIVRGTIISMIMFFSANMVANFFSAPLVKPILEVMALALFINGFGNIGTTYFLKELDFKWRVYLEQGAELVGIVLTIVLAFLLKSVWALVIGYVLQEVVKVLLSYKIHPFRPSFQFNVTIAKELFRYGKHILGASILYFLIRQGDNALVGRILGMKELGFYTLAFSLANLPTTFFSRVISQVIFPAFSKLQDDRSRLQDAYLKVLKVVALVAIPCTVGIFILAPDIVKVLYGTNYLPMIPAVRVLCLFGLLRALIYVHSDLFKAYGHPRLLVKFGLLQLIVMAFLIYPLSIRFGISGTSLATTIAIFASFSLAILRANKMIELRLREAIYSISPAVLYSLVMALSIFLLHTSLAKVELFQLFAIITFGSLVYVVQVLIFEREMIGWYLTQVFPLSTRPT